MKKLYSDFLKMKDFFLERQKEYVFYRVKPLSYREAYSDYCLIDRFRDGFTVEFDWRRDDNPELYGIESYDSFVFGIYCLYYEDKIVLTDLNRSWECGVEAFEGSGLAAVHFDEMADFIKKHGYSLSDKPRQDTIIAKETDIESFVRDAIELVRIMLTINRIDDTPPYLHEDSKEILNDISALEASWLTEVAKRPTVSRAPTVIDLTHSITEGMPSYPDDPIAKLIPSGEYERREPRITAISLCSHTGTHMDAPSHLFAGGRTITDAPADYFIGKALVIDCRGLKEGESISRELIKGYGERLDEADFILLCTGWDKKWGTEEYFDGFPTLDTWGAAEITRAGIRIIGVDAPSVDSPRDTRLSRHSQILSDNNVFIIENLKNLDLIVGEVVQLIALPLKLSDIDGSPVRAVAIKG